MDENVIHLQQKGGIDIPHDGVVSDYIKSGADIYVVGGKGNIYSCENQLATNGDKQID
jgi:hypothetical protein